MKNELFWDTHSEKLSSENSFVGTLIDWKQIFSHLNKILSFDWRISVYFELMFTNVSHFEGKGIHVKINVEKVEIDNQNTTRG